MKINENFKNAVEVLSLSYTPKNPSGREVETSVLKEAVQTFLTEKALSQFFVYICGLPGNGKTLIIRKVLSAFNKQARIWEFNAATVFSPKSIYVELLLFLKNIKKKPKGALEALENIFNSETFGKKKYILFIDELDYLANRAARVFYNLIDWLSTHKRNFFIVSAANSMTLPEAFDRKIYSRISNFLKIPFYPYSSAQLQSIIEERLVKAKLFDKKAVELLTKKVASVSGDVRRVLLIARNALEIENGQNVGTGSIIAAATELSNSPLLRFIPKLSKIKQLILLIFAVKIKSFESEFLSWKLIFFVYKEKAKVLKIKEIENEEEFLKEVRELEQIGLMVQQNPKMKFAENFGLCVFYSDIKEVFKKNNKTFLNEFKNF